MKVFCYNPVDRPAGCGGWSPDDTHLVAVTGKAKQVEISLNSTIVLNISDSFPGNI